MKRLVYNISRYRRVDRRRSLFRCGGLILFSLLLIVLGILSIRDHRREIRDHRMEWQSLVDDIESLEGSTEDLMRDIQDIRRDWDERVNWVNRLMTAATRPLVGRLTWLEGLLPSRLHIRELRYREDPDQPFGMEFIVRSTVFADLVDLYQRLRRESVDFQVREEEITESGNEARIILKLSDEKQ